MTNSKTLIAFAASMSVLVLLVSSISALTVAEITHTFSGGAACLVLDPPEGTITNHDNAQPGDEFTIRQFVTNNCRNEIEVEIVLNQPTPEDWYEIDDHASGTFFMDPGEALDDVHYEIEFGNDMPVEFDGLDVTFRIKRP